MNDYVTTIITYENKIKHKGLKQMYPKYAFNLDEVHKWHNIDISLDKF